MKEGNLYMSISNWFQSFCANLRMFDDDIKLVQNRYKQITKRINLDYYDKCSEADNSLYVGSYGRGTSINLSDVDLIVILPYETYKNFDSYLSNGQSALLSQVRSVLQKTYSTTHIKGDGQVVVIKFQDGICFEIVPGFINNDGISYT